MEEKNDCFAHEKFILKLFGLKSSQNIFYRIYGISILSILTLYQMLLFQSISKTSNANVDELVINLMFAHSKTTVLIAAYYFYWNRLKIEKVLEKMDGLNTISNCDNIIDGNGIMVKYKILIRKQGFFASIMVVSATSTITLLCSILSLNKEEWILAFGSGIDVNNNNIKFLLNFVFTTIFGVLAMLNLFMYANLLTFASGHCKLFQEYITAIMDCRDINSSQNIQNQSQESNDFQILNNEHNFIDWKTFKITLRKLIPYHVSIYEAGAEVESVFNMVVLLFFGGFSIVSCVALYHITTVNILSAPGFRDLWALLVANIPMILISFWGEQIQTESEKIGRVCYEVEFARADIRIQKSLLLIMIRAQKPIVPTIGKFKILNLNTMLGILQSIYSYYTILRNLTRD